MPPPILPNPACLYSHERWTDTSSWLRIKQAFVPKHQIHNIWSHLVSESRCFVQQRLSRLFTHDEFAHFRRSLTRVKPIARVVLKVNAIVIQLIQDKKDVFESFLLVQNKPADSEFDHCDLLTNKNKSSRLKNFSFLITPKIQKGRKSTVERITNKIVFFFFFILLLFCFSVSFFF